VPGRYLQPFGAAKQQVFLDTLAGCANVKLAIAAA